MLELETATLSARDREPFFKWTFYTPLYDKDTKQSQKRPMETTVTSGEEQQL